MTGLTGTTIRKRLHGLDPSSALCFPPHHHSGNTTNPTPSNLNGAALLHWRRGATAAAAPPRLQTWQAWICGSDRTGSHSQASPSFPTSPSSPISKVAGQRAHDVKNHPGAHPVQSLLSFYDVTRAKAAAGIAAWGAGISHRPQGAQERLGSLPRGRPVHTYHH